MFRPGPMVLILLLCAFLAPAAAGAATLPAGGLRTISTTATTPAAPATGMLYIDSMPPGAAVSVDGTAAGTTPATLEVAAGWHTVSLTLAGYEDSTGRMEVPAGGSVRQVITLTAIRTPVPTATGTTPEPEPTVTCTPPCECLLPAQAMERFATSTRCLDIPCGYEVAPTGAREAKYCYRAAETPVSTTATQTTRTAETPVSTTAQATTPMETPTATTTATTTREPVTPVPVTTTLRPRVTVSPAATPTPLQLQGPGISSLAAAASGLAKFTPITAGGGGVSRAAPAEVGSPLYLSQFGALVTKLPPTFTYLDVDEINGDLSGYHSGVEMHLRPNWTYADTSVIDVNRTVQYVNFRVNTSEKNVKGLVWQVSRYPFPANATLWQNEYVPGLVAYGQVKGEYTDEEGYTWFRINFARVANRNPSLPPYYAGTVSLAESGTPGMGTPKAVVKVPLTGGGIVMNPVHLGPLTLGIPSGFQSYPAGELTQEELGSPASGTTLVSEETLTLRPFTPLESLAVSGLDQTFFIRVIPIHDGGKGGIPSASVTSTIRRPHPCPTGVNADVTLKPPSARIISYAPMLWAPNMYPGHYVWFADPCAEMTPATPTATQIMVGLGGGGVMGATSDGWETDFYCNAFKGGAAQGRVGYHYYVPPPAPKEHHWYDFIVDFFSDLLGFLEAFTNALSTSFNLIKKAAALATAKILTMTLFGGLYDCSAHEECIRIIEAGQDAVLVYFGVPPTVPTFDELQDAGAEYLVSLTADQMGVGGVYDTLPESAKTAAANYVSGGAHSVAEGMVGSQRDETKKQMQAAIGGWSMPDPLFTAPHQAIAMVGVRNPNSQTSDRVVITVRDSAGLFHPAQKVIPPLRPGEGVTVPVILGENYEQYYGNGCPKKADAVTYSGSAVQYPWQIDCVHEKWYNAYGSLGQDDIQVSVGASTGHGEGYTGGGAFVDNLDQGADGKLLTTYLVLDPGTTKGYCPISSTLRYPAGWTITIQGRTVNPDEWDSGLLDQSSGTQGMFVKEQSSLLFAPLEGFQKY